MDEGVGRLADADRQVPLLHQEVAVAPGIRDAGLGEVHMLPSKLLVACLSPGQGKAGQQENQQHARCFQNHLALKGEKEER